MEGMQLQGTAWHCCALTHPWTVTPGQWDVLVVQEPNTEHRESGRGVKHLKSWGQASIKVAPVWLAVSIL